MAERVVRRTKPAKKLLGDKAYDSAELRQWLEDRGTKAVIPNRSNRKQPFSFDKKSYKQRHRIENAFCRLKDFRRIATRACWKFPTNLLARGSYSSDSSPTSFLSESKCWNSRRA